MLRFQTTIKIEEEKADYGKFVVEPLNPGFGHTLGNALRRVLLSSLSGAAITQVKISGVAHEFSTLPGVKEDMVELILNLKKINFIMTKKQPVVVSLVQVGHGNISAGDLKCPAGIEVANKDLHLASLTNKKAKLGFEATVKYGRGYHLPESGLPVGVIPLDSNFSPVRKVLYKVELTRVGRVTNLDKLVLEIFTNKAVGPGDALKQAAAILIDQLKVIAGEAQIEEVPVRDEEKLKVVESKIYVEELNLPTRILNILKKAKVETVTDVENKGEEGLSKIKNIGPKTIKLILRKVSKLKKEGAVI